MGKKPTTRKRETGSWDRKGEPQTFRMYAGEKFTREGGFKPSTSKAKVASAKRILQEKGYKVRTARFQGKYVIYRRRA